MTYLRSEFLKLLRPLTWYAVGCLVALFLIMMLMAQDTASRQWTIAQDAVAYASGETSCSSYALPEGPDCTAARQQDLASAKRFVEETRADAWFVVASRSPVGLVGWAASAVISVPGSIILMAIYAAHIAEEWEKRTIAGVLSRSVSRRRFIVSKYISSIGVSYATLASCWVVGFAAIPVLRSVFVLPDLHPGAPVAAFAWSRLGGAVVSIPLLAAIGVLIAVRVKKVLETVLLGSGAVVAFNVLTLAPSANLLNPAAWVARVMQFERRPIVQDHLWAESSPFLNSGLSAVLLALTTGLLLWCSIRWMDRSDVV